jgi:hypothetical protein
MAARSCPRAATYVRTVVVPAAEETPAVWETLTPPSHPRGPCNDHAAADRCGSRRETRRTCRERHEYRRHRGRRGTGRPGRGCRDRGRRKAGDHPRPGTGAVPGRAGIRSRRDEPAHREDAHRCRRPGQDRGRPRPGDGQPIQQGRPGAGGQGTLTAYAALSTEICERTAGLLAVAATAAESDGKLAEMRASALHRRHQDCATVIGALNADGSLTSGLTLAEAADIFYALTSPETYLVLTRERGWPPGRYEKWLVHTLAASLLDNGRAGGMAQGRQTDFDTTMA